MPFVPMLELLQDAKHQHYAVPGFCCWNAETMETVLSVAIRRKAPVILMWATPDFKLIKPRLAVEIAHVVASHYEARAALHLDHGKSLTQVEACLAAGFTSVMLDYSARSYEENVDALRRVVNMAHPLEITVEGEIGHVGKADKNMQESEFGPSTLTEPEDAAAYVKDTGVDALAISIGNAHGQYTALPSFDFERLIAIREAVSAPLVLHGGTGTPDEHLRKAISLGITKVNVATDIILSVRNSLLEQWQAGKNLWVPVAQAEAMYKMAGVVEKWLDLTGAVGRAA